MPRFRIILAFRDPCVAELRSAPAPTIVANNVDEAEALVLQEYGEHIYHVVGGEMDLTECPHPWHDNPGLINPCPECGVIS